MRRLFFFALICVCTLSACFFGRRGRALTSAVEASSSCDDDFEKRQLEPGLYRVHACPDKRGYYQHEGIYQCSRIRCDNLSDAARRLHAATHSCPLAQVVSGPTPDLRIFRVSGCEHDALIRCEMRDQQTRCDALPQAATVPPAATGVAL